MGGIGFFCIQLIYRELTARMTGLAPPCTPCIRTTTRELMAACLSWRCY